MSIKKNESTTMMSVGNLAERLGVSQKTIYRWLAEKKIGSIRLGPNMTVLITEKQFQDFLAAYEVSPVKPETKENQGGD
jgi:excisionase family DNA binding protein